MSNRMVSAIEAIAFVRSVLTKAMSRIGPPQWGQTISLLKVRSSNSCRFKKANHGIYFLRRFLLNPNLGY